MIKEALDINIPISDQIDREIVVDNKRYDRVGACYKYIYPKKRYVIHLSSDVLKGSKYMIKSIIAHEISHKCMFCTEHGYLWSCYKNKMVNFYNYNIKVKYSWNEIYKRR